MVEWLTSIVHSKALVVLGVLALLMILERIFPMVELRKQITRLTRNFSLAALNILISPFIVVPLTFTAATFSWHWRGAGMHSLVVDILVLDCWIYFWHRLNHAVPLLWRFHEVHHLDENLDASSALRFHFGEVILSSVVRAVVIIALDVPLTSVVVFETIVSVAALFHHSNIKLPAALERALALLIVTPSIHFVHHHALRRDTDSNYATVLSLWDYLFGSRSATARHAGLKIGVEGSKDESIFRLIFRPFYRT